MKFIFRTRFYSPILDLGLLILLIAIACFMLQHGLPKLFKFFSDEPLKFADPLGMGNVTSLVLTVFAEVFCSVLILLGLATRLAVIPLMITMLVAIIIVHQLEFSKYEDAALYFLVYFTFLW